MSECRKYLRSDNYVCINIWYVVIHWNQPISKNTIIADDETTIK